MAFQKELGCDFSLSRSDFGARGKCDVVKRTGVAKLAQATVRPLPTHNQAAALQRRKEAQDTAQDVGPEIQEAHHLSSFVAVFRRSKCKRDENTIFAMHASR